MLIARKIDKGLSLIELIISSALLTFLLGALMWVIIAGKCVWQSSMARSAARQDLQVACRKISQDLRTGNLALVTNSTAGSPPAFSVLSARDRFGSFITSTADGTPSWQKYVIYYIPTGTTSLLRKEVYGIFSGALPASQLAAYCDGSGTTISKSMTVLRLTPEASSKAMRLYLEARSTNRHGKSDAQSLETIIYLLN